MVSITPKKTYRHLDIADAARWNTQNILQLRKLHFPISMTLSWTFLELLVMNLIVRRIIAVLCHFSRKKVERCASSMIGSYGLCAAKFRLLSIIISTLSFSPPARIERPASKDLCFCGRNQHHQNEFSQSSRQTLTPLLPHRQPLRHDGYSRRRGSSHYKTN